MAHDLFHSFLLTPLTQGLDALQMVCHFLLRPSKFRLCLRKLMSRCIILLDPSADGGSTGRAWLWVEIFGQKIDVILDNARIAEEYFNFRFELGDLEVQCVVLV